MKISKKSELFELLKIFQKQITTIKTTIDKLIQKSEESDGDILEFSSEGIPQVQDLDNNIQDSEPELPKPPKISLQDLNISDNELTSLPPKPESLKKEKKEEIDEIELKPVPKLKSKTKTKKELKDERNGLEAKLSSVQDLLEFIDKKHSSGTIDDDEFSKRSKKLQNDIKKTKKKISVIDKLLEK